MANPQIIDVYPWLPIQSCELYIDNDPGKDPGLSLVEQLRPTALLARDERNLKHMVEERDHGHQVWLKSNSQDCCFFPLNLLMQVVPSHPLHVGPKWVPELPAVRNNKCYIALLICSRSFSVSSQNPVANLCILGLKRLFIWNYNPGTLTLVNSLEVPRI